MKIRIVGLVIIIFSIIAGCSNKDSEPTNNLIINVLKTEYGGCFYNSFGAAKSDEWLVDSLYFQPDTSGLKVIINKIDNCCADLIDSYTIEGDTIKIFIQDIAAEQCRCNCQFDITYSLGLLNSQTIFAKVYYQGFGQSTFSLWKETYLCYGLIL
jgi:hypothetical protein